MAPSGAIPHIVWLVCIEWLGGATNGSPTWARLITEQWLLLRSQNGSFTFICVWSHGAVETCSYASSSYVSVNELLMRKVLIVQQNVISSIFLIIMSGLFMVELDCFNEIFNGFVLLIICRAFVRAHSHILWSRSQVHIVTCRRVGVSSKPIGLQLLKALARKWTRLPF